MYRQYQIVFPVINNPMGALPLQRKELRATEAPSAAGYWLENSPLSDGHFHIEAVTEPSPESSTPKLLGYRVIFTPSEVICDEAIVVSNRVQFAAQLAYELLIHWLQQEVPGVDARQVCAYAEGYFDSVVLSYAIKTDTTDEAEELMWALRQQIYTQGHKGGVMTIGDDEEEKELDRRRDAAFDIQLYIWHAACDDNGDGFGPADGDGIVVIEAEVPFPILATMGWQNIAAWKNEKEMVDRLSQDVLAVIRHQVTVDPSLRSDAPSEAELAGLPPALRELVARHLSGDAEPMTDAAWQSLHDSGGYQQVLAHTGVDLAIPWSEQQQLRRDLAAWLTENKLYRPDQRTLDPEDIDGVFVSDRYLDQELKDLRMSNRQGARVAQSA